ncbi:tripartite tricarboxylate transporter substrate binding protein [Candidatus Omnitrophota bacterium]
MKNILVPILVLILIVSLFTFVIWQKRSSDSVDDSAEPSGYPDKPITYVVCFNPGGESDITARLQQKLLEDIVGVPIVITYKQGGGGAVGWSELMRTKPDGYTMYGTNLPHIIVQPMTRGDAGYRTEKIRNVYIFGFTPNILAVGKDSPIKTVRDFIEYASKNPGMTIGGSGQPSANSIGAEAFAKAAKLDLTYISFTGSGAAVPALLGGHVEALMTFTSMGARYSDRMHVLAVAAEKRLKALPDVPTFLELGYDLVEGAHRGVAVPPDTPDVVCRVLENAFEKVSHNPDVIKDMEEMGFIMEHYDEEQSGKLVRELTQYYRTLLNDIKEAK